MVDNINNTWWYKYTMRRIERYYDQMQQNIENIDDTIIFYNEWKDEKKQIMTKKMINQFGQIY